MIKILLGAVVLGLSLAAMASAQNRRWRSFENRKVLTFDFNCARTDSFPNTSLGKIVERAFKSEDRGGLGTYGDRAFAIILQNQSASTYFVPTVLRRNRKLHVATLYNQAVEVSRRDQRGIHLHLSISRRSADYYHVWPHQCFRRWTLNLCSQQRYVSAIGRRILDRCSETQWPSDAEVSPNSKASVQRLRRLIQMGA